VKVGDLVKDTLDGRIGVVMECSASPYKNDVFWVRWSRDCDWSLHYPEDVEVINESR